MSMTEHGVRLKRRRKRASRTGDTHKIVDAGYKKFMAKHGMPLDPFRPRSRRSNTCGACGGFIAPGSVDCPHCLAIDVEE